MTANVADKETKRSAAADGGKANPHEAVKVKDRRHVAAEPDAKTDGGAENCEEPKTAPANDEVLALQAKLSLSEARLSATLSQYKEALEEFDGAKARLKRDIGKEIDAGKRNILTTLLEVLDNLERAIEAAAPRQSTNDGFFDGVSMVRDQFRQKLEGMGVLRREALGEPFDPDHFEAISTVPVPDAAQDGQVVGVVRHCYTIGGETLRHGMVAVGKHG